MSRLTRFLFRTRHVYDALGEVGSVATSKVRKLDSQIAQMPYLVETTPRWIRLDTASAIDPAHVADIAHRQGHVLISGPGDDALELARTIHALSPRSTRPIALTVWREDFPESLIHSELFGHLAGGFVGAYRSHRGLIWRMDGGTLVIPVARCATPNFRRVLDRFAATGDVWPIGASSPAGRVDVRVIDIRRDEMPTGRFAQRPAL